MMLNLQMTIDHRQLLQGGAGFLVLAYALRNILTCMHALPRWSERYSRAFAFLDDWPLSGPARVVIQDDIGRHPAHADHA